MNSVVTQASPPVYGQVERYINRELSILDFNLRVLEQAVDPLNPLLEKLNFLLIFSRNLDEFFDIRVATMLEHFVQERDIQTADGLSPQEILHQISETAYAAIER